MSVINQLIGTNYTPGRDGNRLQFIILHTVAGSAQSAVATFNNPSKARSANEIICLNGDRIICVGEGDSSWGAANWYVNQRGYNIEHEDNGNYNDSARTDALYAASAARVADLCRRYGVPCQLVGTTGTAAKNPTGPGILLHKDVSQSGTACPDGLDHGRIIREAQAILGSHLPVPPAIPAAAEPHVNYSPLNQAIAVKIQTLLVRALPTTKSAPGQANTPDGALHYGNTITITGFTHAQDPYGDGRDVWLRTVWGHWIWAYGTDFDLAQATPAAAAPTAPVIEAAVQVAIDTYPKPAGVTSYDDSPQVQGVKTTQQATVAIDALGKGAPKSVPANQPVDVWAVVQFNGSGYVRTKYSALHKTWYLIPLGAFKEVEVAAAQPKPGMGAVDGITPANQVQYELPEDAAAAAQPTSVDLAGGIGALYAKLKAILEEIGKLLPGRK